MISPTALVDVLPVVVSLILIEGLLSVDNALAIAALASSLPKHQQTFALRIGILGAYVFRGIALFVASFIIANLWLKFIGAAYLIYLMASNLAAVGSGDDGQEDGAGGRRARGLFLTVLQIELMDLTLSLDNVVAAVALDKRLWVVCTGVFIGILCLRFLAGLCIRLIEKFPVLESTAFLLIGFVGAILLVEIGCDASGHPVHIGSFQKFAGIVAIVGLSLLYDGNQKAKTLLAPAVRAGLPIMAALDKVVGALFWPAARCIHFGKAVFLDKPAARTETTNS